MKTVVAVGRNTLLELVSLKLECLGMCIKAGSRLLKLLLLLLGAAFLKRRLRVQWKNRCMWLPGLYWKFSIAGLRIGM